MSRVPDEAQMTEARFGQVYNRPAYQPDVRVMCIAPYRDTIDGGWTGIVLADVEGQRMESGRLGRSGVGSVVRDLVGDGWALIE